MNLRTKFIYIILIFFSLLLLFSIKSLGVYHTVWNDIDLYFPDFPNYDESIYTNKFIYVNMDTNIWYLVLLPYNSIVRYVTSDVVTSSNSYLANSIEVLKGENSAEILQYKYEINKDWEYSYKPQDTIGCSWPGFTTDNNFGTQRIMVYSTQDIHFINTNNSFVTETPMDYIYSSEQTPEAIPEETLETQEVKIPKLETAEQIPQAMGQTMKIVIPVGLVVLGIGLVIYLIKRVIYSHQ